MKMVRVPETVALLAALPKKGKFPPSIQKEIERQKGMYKKVQQALDNVYQVWNKELTNGENIKSMTKNVNVALKEAQTLMEKVWNDILNRNVDEPKKYKLFSSVEMIGASKEAFSNLVTLAQLQKDHADEAEEMDLPMAIKCVGPKALTRGDRSLKMDPTKMKKVGKKTVVMWTHGRVFDADLDVYSYQGKMWIKDEDFDAI